jgi:hypothetical protein
MKRKRSRLLLLSCLLALLAGGLHTIAQEKVATQADTFKVLTAKFAFGPVVKGAPYSATAITETTQALSDGNQIIRRNETKLYRDSEGRTRVDQKLETIGKWTAGEAQEITFINDPVTGFNYDLDHRNRTARKSADSKIAFTKMEMAKMEMAEIEKLKQEKLKALEAQGKLKDGLPPGDAPLKKLPPPGEAPLKKLDPANLKEGVSPDGRRKNELLGKQVIEGVEAEGRRTTLTIPAGEIGNTLPIEIVDEQWYSPELQVMVMTKHSDPRSGVTTYRLTNINRSEPDRTLFEVPADYTVRDNTVLPKKKRPPEEEH